MAEIKKIKVLYEDNHLIAVDKPSGWLVQGDKTGDKPLSDFVKAYIKKKYKKPGDVFLGVIHRLDRPVSGVVIFAKTSKALTRMNKLFKDREITKEYRAVTGERPKPMSDTLKHYLIKDKEKNIARAYDARGNRTKEAKESILKYRLLQSMGMNHLVEILPETGRPHQIRVQLSKIGCPIRGDVKYGFNKPNHDASIHLHCFRLSFIHPVKKEPIKIKARAPKDQIWGLFSDLEG